MRQAAFEDRRINNDMASWPIGYERLLRTRIPCRSIERGVVGCASLSPTRNRPLNADLSKDKSPPHLLRHYFTYTHVDPTNQALNQSTEQWCTDNVMHAQFPSPVSCVLVHISITNVILSFW